MRKQSIIYIASLLLFGSNGIIAAAIPLTSSQIVMLRTFIGGLFLAGVLALTYRKAAPRPSRRESAYLAASGVCTGLSWVTLYEAYRLVGVGISSLEYYCAPIIVMAVSIPLFKERLTVGKTTGFIVVLVGTLLVSEEALGTGGDAWGLTLGGLSALCHAGMVIFSKKAEGINGLQSSTVQIGISFLIAALFAAGSGGFGFLGAIPASAWPAIVVLGLVNTGLGCLMYFSAIVHLPAQTVATLGYLEPLSAVLLAVLVLGEPLSALQWMGAALIIGGAVLAEMRPMKADYAHGA